MAPGILQKGKALIKSGEYRDAVNLLEKSCAEANKSGTQMEKYESALHFGRALRFLSRFDEAAKQLNDACGMAVELTGECGFEHSHALTELGYVYLQKAMFSEAQSCLTKALAIRQSLSAEPDESIAEVHHYFGMLFWRKGDDQEALASYEKALEMRARTLGELHEDYADTLDNMGVIYQRISDFSRAEAAHRKSLEIRLKRLGENHPDVGYSMLNLAGALNMLGRSDDYLDASDKVISLWTRAVGEDSMDVLEVINNKGVFHLSRGDFREASRCFEKALSGKEKLMGKDNPRLTVSLCNLALVYRQTNRKKEAEELESRAEKMMLEKIETEGEKDLEVVIMLADRWKNQGRTAEAVNLVERAEKVAAAEFGPESLKVARCLSFLGALHFLENPEKAKEFYARVVRIEKREYGQRSPKVAESIRMLSNCFMMQGDNSTSGVLSSQARSIEFAAGIEDPEEKICKMMLNKREEIFGEDDSAVLQTKRMMAEFMRVQGREDEAEELYSEYMQGLKAQVGEDSLDYADELFMSGMMQATRNEHEKGLDQLKQSLEILQKLPDVDPRDILMTLDCMALSQEALELWDDEEKCARESLRLREQVYGDKHFSLRGALERLQKAAERRGERSESEALKNRLSEIPEPTALEQSEWINEQGDRTTRMLTKALGGLGAMVQLLAPDGEQADLGI